ncbi:MAG: glycosyltransferase family 1 protein [bacterium]
MKIGIDASRAFLKQRTGIEEYSYQVIENLTNYLQNEQVILYIRKNQKIDFKLPENWKITEIRFPIFWTQFGLSLEMFLHPVEKLFVPAHTVPMIHPRNTIVTVHGLEYEFLPRAYSWFERFYMRLTIKKSCIWANVIISVSENTKKDLIELYGIANEKIKVIYEGYGNKIQNPNDKYQIKSKIRNQKFLLFLGRIEERKNIANIIKAFDILKEKYNIPHHLILAGKPGHNYVNIKFQISNSKWNEEIQEFGFVGDDEKWELLKNADVFVFPTQYEGFGIPILEAQSVGCCVVASNNSSISEITSCHSGLEPESGLEKAKMQFDTCSAALVDPSNPNEIAENIFEIISNKEKKKDLIKKGLKNVKRFDWDQCAREISVILKGE